MGSRLRSQLLLRISRLNGRSCDPAQNLPCEEADWRLAFSDGVTQVETCGWSEAARICRVYDEP